MLSVPRAENYRLLQNLHYYLLFSEIVVKAIDNRNVGFSITSRMVINFCRLLSIQINKCDMTSVVWWHFQLMTVGIFSVDTFPTPITLDI